MKNATLAGALASLLAVAGCSSSKGGGASTTTQQEQRQAVVALSTAGGAGISGVEMTLQLPAGVSVAADATSGKTAGGVVAPSGVAASGAVAAVGHYAPAASTVKVAMVRMAEFGAGEFATVTCNLAQGTTVTASDFSVAGIKAIDANGAPVAGVTGTVAVR